jgi:hypothetical protein
LIFWLLGGCDTSAIYVATVEVRDDGHSIGRAAGGLGLAAHAEAVRMVFPEDMPYTDLQPVSVAVRGWGDSEAEAVRNASARLDQVMALRRQALFREMMWLTAQQKRHADPSAPFSDDTTYYDPGGTSEGWGERMQPLASEISREMYWLATHLDTVRVRNTETMPRGAVTARHAPDDRCDAQLELTQTPTPTSGAGYDLFAAYACEQGYAASLIVAHEAAAHAGPIRQQIFGKMLTQAEDCYTLCLETINLTP